MTSKISQSIIFLHGGEYQVWHEACMVEKLKLSLRGKKY
jgi:hypothetical protein